MLHFCLLLNAGVRNFCYTLYILQDYYSAHQRPGSRPTAFHMFIEQIYHELVGTHRRAAVNLPHRRSGADMSTLVNVGTVPVHMPERDHRQRQEATDVLFVQRSIKLPRGRILDVKRRSCQSDARLLSMLSLSSFSLHFIWTRQLLCIIPQQSRILALTELAQCASTQVNELSSSDSSQ